MSVRLVLQTPLRPDPREAVWQVLVLRVAAGDSEALSELYDQSVELLYALALRVVRDEQDAEEVVHDVYCRVWRTASSYDSSRGSAFGWLILMTRSLAIDRVRSSRRHYSIERVDAWLPAPGRAPDTTAGDRQRSTRIQSALRHLPEEQAAPIELAFFDGLTHTELSARLGVPLGTIKARIRSGLLHLRRRLGDLAS